jgi:hypothetical protein
MDPIASAIVAALSAGLLESTGKIAGQAVADLYAGLKQLIKSKYGEHSEVAKAVDELEKKPESAGRKGTLEEELAAVKAGTDPEILKVARALLDELREGSVVESSVQMASGSNIVQADRGSKASLNITQTDKDKDGR